MRIDVEMKIIYKAADNPVKAIAVVILEDSLVIHNVKIIDLSRLRLRKHCSAFC